MKRLPIDKLGIFSQQIKGLIYVAGPYHRGGKCSKEEILENIQKAEEASIKLILDGWSVFTPHKNNSGYEKYEEVYSELSSKEWIRRDLEILGRCDAVFFLEGWRESPGSVLEYEFSIREEIPTFFQENLRDSTILHQKHQKHQKH